MSTSGSSLDLGAVLGESCPVTGPPNPSKPLHRIAAVRRQQGVSLRRVSHHLGAYVGQLRREEDEQSDMRLSRLYEWQRVLDVPVADLLVDSDAPLSTPVMQRAQLLRVMKTVTAILEKTEDVSIRRLAQTLTEQLLEIMPELEGVSPWHTVGQRRTLNELGRIAERVYSSDLCPDD